METFVVRVFVPAGEERLELSGFVEHASTGRAESFSGPDGLIDVVLRELELAAVPGPMRVEGEEKR